VQLLLTTKTSQGRLSGTSIAASDSIVRRTDTARFSVQIATVIRALLSLNGVRSNLPRSDCAAVGSCGPLIYADPAASLISAYLLPFGITNFPRAPIKGSRRSCAKSSAACVTPGQWR